MTDRDLQDASDLSLYAARLVRLIRKERRQPPGMRVLSMLDELGPSGITALATADQCSQPTMSGTVASLVEHGWVRKDPSPDDARAILVSLTPAGEQVLARARRANGRLIAERLRRTDLTDDDLATAVTVVRSLLTLDPKGNS